MAEIDNKITLKFLLQLMDIERRYSDEEINKRTKRREEIGELINNFTIKEIENED
jgi:hypothetical protein